MGALRYDFGVPRLGQLWFGEARLGAACHGEVGRSAVSSGAVWSGLPRSGPARRGRGGGRVEHIRVRVPDAHARRAVAW
jgi:hypothetical protein